MCIKILGSLNLVSCLALEYKFVFVKNVPKKEAISRKVCFLIWDSFGPSFFWAWKLQILDINFDETNPSSSCLREQLWKYDFLFIFCFALHEQKAHLIDHNPWENISTYYYDFEQAFLSVFVFLVFVTSFLWIA